MKVLYLCHFSNKMVRQNLALKKWNVRNKVLKIFHHVPQQHADYAVWNTDFISEFERHEDVEFHIVSPHKGMKKRAYHFDNNGIHYHFFSDDNNLIIDFLRAKLNIDRKTEFRRNRVRIKKIIDNVKPDLVVLCGSECTSFAIAILDICSIPIYVILQSCTNLQRYIKAGIGSDFGRAVERSVFKKSMYFGTTNEEYFKKYKEFNKNAVCLPVRFPSHHPPIFVMKKEYDFVFFGRVIANKGIEEVIKALSEVIKSYPKALLNIIGLCDPYYKDRLKSLIGERGLEDNIEFSPFYENMDDMYYQVQKSRCAVLPGITAPLNSTVRESMFMRMPTIVFNNKTVAKINAEKQCLLAAEMLNTQDLAQKMLYTIDYPNEIVKIANNAYIYASENLSNKKIGDVFVDNMKAIYNNATLGKEIPNELLYNSQANL